MTALKLAVSRVHAWWQTGRTRLAAAWLRRQRTKQRIVAGARPIASVGLTLAAWLSYPSQAFAAPAAQGEGGISGTVALAAALSTGLAALAAGIAVAVVGSAAVGAVSEDRQNLGRVLIFVGLAEGVAIYGLIISFLILTS